MATGKTVGGTPWNHWATPSPFQAGEHCSRRPGTGGPCEGHPGSVPKTSPTRWVPRRNGAPCPEFWSWTTRRTRSAFSPSGCKIEGFEVLTARSADIAFDILAREPVDLAIVDLMMPGTNGLELARQVRHHYPKVRVVLTSAYHLSERQLARADCGVVGFVPKPYELGRARGLPPLQDAASTRSPPLLSPR